MDLKINEKAAIAQKQFMDKCAKLVEGVKLGFGPDAENDGTLLKI